MPTRISTSHKSISSKGCGWWLRQTGKRVLVLLVFVAAWFCWQPGTDLRDGRHDRRRNGLWLAHGWMGGDAWFRENRKLDQKPSFRSEEALAALAARVREHGITELYPHLCPVEAEGRLPEVDDAATERLLDALPAATAAGDGGVRVWPWVGGTLDHTDLENAAWRRQFAENVAGLMERHPRLAGAHVNIEPLPDGTPSYLLLLEEMRARMPAGKKLSVAAYPPPTRWHPFPEVHWGEPYFREVARRCDQLTVMAYDTGIRFQKPYRKLMADWTREILDWSEGREVLIGVPAYGDAGVDWHRPEVENLENALAGVHTGLLSFPELPANYRGVAIYCDWEMTSDKWAEFRARFGRREF